MQSFISELRRRNVLRVAAFYAAAGWLLVQVATQVFPFYDIPNWVVRVVVTGIALGFPGALLFAWFYELTPQGLKLESEVVRNESITRQTGRKLDRWIIAVLGLAVALLLTDKLMRHKSASAPAADAASGTVSPTTPEVAADDKSIAVLPFENLSRDPDNAYFAQGIQDEILTRLAKIGSLKVISRTSTQQYAAKPGNLSEIGKQLGVANLLEGSVQKAGDAVHINVQLIRAATDAHVWAETYDRKLDNIFGVEGEVAGAIAQQLQATLSGTERQALAQKSTDSPEAFDLYLRANAHANRAYDQDILTSTELPLAIALYEQAVAKDPGFALAYAALGRAHMSMYFNAPDRTEARLVAGRKGAEQALALQPDLGEGHYALALYYYWGHRDYPTALEQLALARKSLPNSADVAILAAAIARRQGSWEQALAGFRQATVLDPHSDYSLDQLGFTYANVRRYADADAAFARAAALTADPADELVTRSLNIVTWKGDLAPLRAALGALVPGSDAYAGNVASTFYLGWWQRNYADAIRAAESDQAESWSDQANGILPRRLYLAWAYAAAGDLTRAQVQYAAIEAQERAALALRPDDADLHLALGFALAGLDRKDEAVREGRQAAVLMPVSRDTLTGASVLVWLAQLYVRIGENRQALDLLQQLQSMPSGVVISPALLRLDPIWDPLRGDPRFQKLIADADAALQAQARP